MPKEKGLTVKQKRFVEEYNGNATDAARKAGYSERNADKIGAQLLNNPRIADAIRAREKERLENSIATREERQMFFTATMRDEEKPTKDRLRAAELLGKSEGDFLDRHELTGKDGAPLMPQPLTIVTKLANAIQRDDGSPINPDTHPEEYAAAWLIDFFADHKDMRTDIKSFCDDFESGKYGDTQGMKISEIVADYLNSRQS